MKRIVAKILFIMILMTLSGCFGYDDATIIDIKQTNSLASTVEEMSCIDIAKEIIEKELKEQENETIFTQQALKNNITIEALYRQPNAFKGKEVHFSGVVLQTI